MKIFCYFIFYIISFLLTANCLYANQPSSNNFKNFGIYQDIIGDHHRQFFNQQAKFAMINRVIIDGFYDNNFDAQNRSDQVKNSSGKIRYLNNLYLTKGLSINSFFSLQNTKKYQQNFTANNGHNQHFQSLGLITEELNLRYLYENKNKKIANNLVLGKFNLGHGTAWQWDRGIWIHQIAQGYQQTEKLGIANLVKLGNIYKTGEYNLGLSFFTNDRKNFDNSLFSNKNTLSKNSAIPGDTRSLKSYNLTLDINFDFKKNEQLSYHLSYLNLAVNGRNSMVNASNIADQKSIVYAIKYQIPLQSNLLLNSLVEYNKSNNYLGDSNRLQSYLTTNLILNYQQNWNLLYGFARLKDRNYLGSSFDRYLNEIALGYQFDTNQYFDKFTAQIGYQHLRTQYLGFKNQDLNSLGILIRYYKYF